MDRIFDFKAEILFWRIYLYFILVGILLVFVTFITFILPFLIILSMFFISVPIMILWYVSFYSTKIGVKRKKRHTNFYEYINRGDKPTYHLLIVGNRNYDEKVRFPKDFRALKRAFRFDDYKPIASMINENSKIVEDVLKEMGISFERKELMRIWTKSPEDITRFFSLIIGDLFRIPFIGSIIMTVPLYWSKMFTTTFSSKSKWGKNAIVFDLLQNNLMILCGVIWYRDSGSIRTYSSVQFYPIYEENMSFIHDLEEAIYTRISSIPNAHFPEIEEF